MRLNSSASIPMASFFGFLLRVVVRGSKERRSSVAMRAEPISVWPITTGEPVSAKVLQIIDGDTVDVGIQGCRVRVRVRLSSIDCPEDGQPWGRTAKAGLIKMIGGKSVTLEVHGADEYGRTIATVFARHGEESKWINVNERMVMLGHAWVLRAYYGHLSPERQRQLNRLEAWARSKKVGLWKTQNPISPWKWRQEQ